MGSRQAALNPKRFERFGWTFPRPAVIIPVLNQHYAKTHSVRCQDLLGALFQVSTQLEVRSTPRHTNLARLRDSNL
jgi:hypothetical protein